MLQQIKATVKNIKIKQCYKEFETEVKRQSDRYACWIAREEDKRAEKAAPQISGDIDSENNSDTDNEKNNGLSVEGTLSAAVLPFQKIDGTNPFDGLREDLVVVVDEASGSLNERALSRIKELFAAHADWDFIYADEDYRVGKKRVAPWMKPDWSPDTLLSFNYIGHFFALRKSRFINIPWLTEGEPALKVYDFLLKCAEEDAQIVHVPEVLFHNRINQAELSAYFRLDQDIPQIMTADEQMPWKDRLIWLAEQSDVQGFCRVREKAMERRGFPGKVQADEKGILQPIYEIAPDAKGNLPFVSIIIPSKDNADILERCIRSLRTHSAYPSYEILIVDNGSSGAVRTHLMILERELHFRYIYRPMEFNFSAMINLGAKEAKGEYLLFLNDDCEVLQDDWLMRMLGQARLPHAGAVGAKLLYPFSDSIQHAGVTNMPVGPAHKLQKASDESSYYYGRNRFAYNCAGVTAACMLIKKEKFDQAGGFDESLKVAYNDVDFCFTLSEMGYYHTIRNDVILYHHESLSRGDDLLSEKKRGRLREERRQLYEKHPAMEGQDPFYSPNLLGNAVDYLVNYRYDYELEDCFTKLLPPPSEIPEEWYNDSIMATVEHCGMPRFRESLKEYAKGEETCLIEGWAYVLEQDNCRYDMSLLLAPLKEDEESEVRFAYEAEVMRRYRPDVVRILPEQTHVELSGFVTRWQLSQIKPGSYRIYLFFKDKCSRQRLIKDTGVVLRTEE